MNRKLLYGGAGVVALLLWLFMARRYGVSVVPGGFTLKPGGDAEIELPGIKLPALPDFKNPPAMWRQSTGLMCACDRTPYTAPVIIRQIDVPPTPLPGYVYRTPSTQQLGTEPPRTYADFGMNDSFTIWAGREYERVYRGSDGRIFLRSGPSNSPSFIGTDEYTMKDGKIYYGPYVYTKAWSGGEFGSR